MKPVTAKSVLSSTNTALRALGTKVEKAIKAKTGHACEFVTVAISAEAGGLNLGTGVIVEAYVRATSTGLYAATDDVVKAIKTATASPRAVLTDTRHATNPRGDSYIVECSVNYKGNDVPQIVTV